MDKIKFFLQEFIYKISYQYKNKKELAKFLQLKEKYLSMDNDEFLIKYIDLSVRCEREKYILSALSITLIISFLLNVWDSTFRVIGKLLITNNYEITNNDINKQISIIMIFLVISLIFFGILFIISLLRRYYKLLKEKKIMEEIKKMRL